MMQGRVTQLLLKGLGITTAFGSIIIFSYRRWKENAEPLNLQSNANVTSTLFNLKKYFASHPLTISATSSQDDKTSTSQHKGTTTLKALQQIFRQPILFGNLSSRFVLRSKHIPYVFHSSLTLLKHPLIRMVLLQGLNQANSKPIVYPVWQAKFDAVTGAQMSHSSAIFVWQSIKGLQPIAIDIMEDPKSVSRSKIIESLPRPVTENKSFARSPNSTPDIKKDNNRIFTKASHVIDILEKEMQNERQVNCCPIL